MGTSCKGVLALVKVMAKTKKDLEGKQKKREFFVARRIRNGHKFIIVIARDFSSTTRRQRKEDHLKNRGKPSTYTPPFFPERSRSRNRPLRREDMYDKNGKCTLPLGDIPKKWQPRSKYPRKEFVRCLSDKKALL